MPRGPERFLLTEGPFDDPDPHITAAGTEGRFDRDPHVTAAGAEGQQQGRTDPLHLQAYISRDINEVIFLLINIFSNLL